MVAWPELVSFACFKAAALADRSSLLEKKKKKNIDFKFCLDGAYQPEKMGCWTVYSNCRACK